MIGSSSAVFWNQRVNTNVYTVNHCTPYLSAITNEILYSKMFICKMGVWNSECICQIKMIHIRLCLVIKHNVIGENTFRLPFSALKKWSVSCCWFGSWNSDHLYILPFQFQNHAVFSCGLWQNLRPRVV